MKGNTEKREPKSRGCGQNLRAESASRRSRAKGRALKIKHKKYEPKAKGRGPNSRAEDRDPKAAHAKGNIKNGEPKVKGRGPNPRAEVRVVKAAHSKENTKNASQRPSIACRRLRIRKGIQKGKNQKVVQVNPRTEGRALKGNTKKPRCA